MQLINSNHSSNGIRSLVCDSNGIIIAETVYRCMICAEIFNTLSDIENHYHLDHLEENLESNSVIENDIVDIDYDNDEYDDHYHLNNNHLSSNFDKFSYDFSIDYNMDDNSEATEEREFQEASPKDENSSLKGGGFVTCEVCGLTKYYSHISRRYGVFSCESCAKFFYRYSQKPVQYVCQNNGQCCLKIDMPGARCKACLLDACLKKYILNPKKHPKIFNQDRLSTVSKNQDFTESITHSKENELKNGCFDTTVHKPKVLCKKANHKLSNSLLANSLSSVESRNEEKIPKLVREVHVGKSKSILSTTIEKKSIDSLNKKIRLPRCRRVACRMCDGCLADDCGKCLYCLDKPKFGGNDIKKQKCIRRRCHRLK